jgi:hypothetical protein
MKGRNILDEEVTFHETIKLYPKKLNGLINIVLKKAYVRVFYPYPLFL